MTLYAEWEINTYSITYNLNGGSLDNAVTTFTINDLPLDLQIPTGETDNLSFVKWTTDEGGNNEIKVIERKEENLKDFSLYAFYEDSANFLTYKYNSEIEGYEVTGYTGSAIKVIIPKQYKGTEIRSIKNGAFYDCNTLEYIILQKNIISIGEGAFELCTALKEISIPDSVVNIGHSAFCRCLNLKSIKLSDNIVYDLNTNDLASSESLGFNLSVLISGNSSSIVYLIPLLSFESIFTPSLSISYSE